METVIANTITKPGREQTRHALEGDIKSASLISFSTLVTWVFCLCVGTAGLLFPYSRPELRKSAPPPVIATMLNVQLTQAPLPHRIPDAKIPDPLKPPPVAQVAAPPAPPEMVAVAEPSSAVAFALPIEGPNRIVEPAQASPVLREEPAGPAVISPPVQAITYGQGEGRQPAPDYPRRAVREGQEGVVRIRFSVGEDGRVRSAEVWSASPWPLLNDAALRVVRGRWRFSEGPMRLYEVAIRFELQK